MEPTEQTGWENRLEELIEGHIRSLKNDFRSFLDELAAPEPPDPEPPDDLQATLVRLKEAVSTILAARSQREMAIHLLEAAFLQASRAALLLVRDGAVYGFEARGFEATTATGIIECFQVEPSGDEPLARAIFATQHLPGTALEGTSLAGWHGGQYPAQVCLAPVYVGTRTVAVVYADSGDTVEPGRIYPEAIEILASMAGLFLDRLRHAARGAARPVEDPLAAGATAATPALDSEPAHAEKDIPVTDDGPTAEAAPVPAVEETTQPAWRSDPGPAPEQAATFPDEPAIPSSGAGSSDPEPRTDGAPGAGFHHESPEPAPAAPASFSIRASIPAPGLALEDADLPASVPLSSDTEPAPFSIRASILAPGSTPEDPDLPTLVPLSDTEPAPTTEEPYADVVPATPADNSPTPATPPEIPPAAAMPVEEAQPFEPTGATPTAGEAAVASDLPANEDAERFARLLVSEIVLYNEAAVKKGRKSGDIYKRLQDSIDRSLEMFVDRFGDELTVLFEAEMIRNLANGDRSLMGSTYS